MKAVIFWNQEINKPYAVNVNPSPRSPAFHLYEFRQ